MAPHGKLITLDFSPQALVGALGKSSAVRYLEGYLTELKATGILFESHYIDRHYLDEFSHYYSTSFASPSSACGRLHFFSSLDAASLNDIVVKAYSKGARDDSEAALNQHYLGFVVLRPLAGAKVGRTVLRTYPSDGKRHFGAVRPYQVNVAGLRLRVTGLAYQQQDRGAAVCASTALWSALQRVAYVDGNRTPTPSAITRASNSPYHASQGLTIEQMASALHSLGYVAEAFRPLENRALFRAKIASYLRSQLPVMLSISRKTTTGAGEVTIGHAITITGYRQPDAIVDVPSANPKMKPIMMRAGAVDTIYVHDDNIGSHAHYELFDVDDVDANGHKKLMLRRGRSADRPQSYEWWPVDEWEVGVALVPKPKKLRMPVSSLFVGLSWIRHAFETMFPESQLHYETRFVSGVEYKRSLFDFDLDSELVPGFQAGLSLPRHVGIISVYDGSLHLCDCVADVSEVERDPSRPPIIGIVAPGAPRFSPSHSNLSKLRNVFNCPMITGAQATHPPTIEPVAVNAGTSIPDGAPSVQVDSSDG